ncbi:S-type pyocin domain-containing protein [Pseudomonas sp. BP8]|uniref:S-type pyocin domain-containing protein n=1 Tax=Pseudomonas sp. BP8 TaxID=2817864 RepID=UPI001AE287B6|nr:S-type pyocin domain-containing protein [Pseudomonas putida]
MTLQRCCQRNHPSRQYIPAAVLTPIEVKIDSYPGVADASFDDYIIVFPADSGLPPIYTMFWDRREDPGRAIGSGPEVDASWARGAANGDGSPVPKQIADLLRGKGFANWKAMRESLWMAVANDDYLSKQFSIGNIERMKKGFAPFVPKSERAGKRDVLELHHKNLISQGGEVYNLENIFLTMPRLHIELHRGKQ